MWYLLTLQCVEQSLVHRDRPATYPYNQNHQYAIKHKLQPTITKKQNNPNGYSPIFTSIQQLKTNINGLDTSKGYIRNINTFQSIKSMYNISSLTNTSMVNTIKINIIKITITITFKNRNDNIIYNSSIELFLMIRLLISIANSNSNTQIYVYLNHSYPIFNYSIIIYLLQIWLYMFGEYKFI